ncbi:MAG: polysaccharide biosynthesis protein [Bacteroidetes bacterium]|nr:MAG: polysaccharide biosynthesis protein [Bacteroidota bacterium]
MNTLKKLAGQTAIYGLSSVIGRILNYLLVPLYTRVFSTEQYGVVTEMYAYVAFLIIILTYGMETAFFRFSSQTEEKSKVYSTTLISIVATSFLFIVFAALFSQSIADWLRYPNHSEYVTWFAIIVGLDALSAIPLAKLREQNRATTFATVNLINIAVNIGLNLFFLVYCKNVYEAGEPNWLVDTFYNPEIGVGYVFISNLVASITKCALLLPWMLNIKLHIDRALLRKMILYASPLLIAGLAGMINETIDRIMIKRLLIDSLGEKATMEQLGIYGACYKISIIITIFIQAFRYAAEPFFFAHHSQSDSKESYATIMNFFVATCSVIFLSIMLFIDVVIQFIGPEFREGVTVVPILLMANLCLGIYFNLSIWYKLTGLTRFGAYIAIAGAAITIVLNYLWIPWIGYLGSAWATLICYAFIAIVSYFIGQKYYPIKYDIPKIIGYPAGAALLYYFSTFISSDMGMFNHVINGVILGAFISFIYMIDIRKTAIK